MTAAATIIVTGGASGIGLAVVGRILDADPSTTVLALDLADCPDRRAHSLHCDLADLDAIAALELPAHVDGLANVAAVPGTAPAAKVLAVNAVGLHALTFRVLERMRAGAAIVNVASVAAHRNTAPADQVARLAMARTDADRAQWLADNPIGGPAAYDTSKRALLEWTVALSAALQPRDIRVVSVSPGPTETPILVDFTASMGAEAMARSAATVGRHGRAAESAAAVAFLLSKDASWINGVDIPVEGGLLAARAAADSPITLEGLSS
ncbi:coniferyl-alcohol dehydrogenase [Gordonia defluvii]|jgi:NAD(P)-dependent dehydrogenase (short-subunit alcohol dehydrogenase family)|uniref:Coniferyl-alcohol dehydrogenase n=1 Tax=Gordonia defluvii TaxID=283718 RepID=A0ABP6LK56_9ACTN|nr:SDR family oxidoreductase [Gordonia sp. UBA5067]